MIQTSCDFARWRGQKSADMTHACVLCTIEECSRHYTACPFIMITASSIAKIYSEATYRRTRALIIAAPLK